MRLRNRDELTMRSLKFELWSQSHVGASTYARVPLHTVKKQQVKSEDIGYAARTNEDDCISHRSTKRCRQHGELTAQKQQGCETANAAATKKKNVVHLVRCEGHTLLGVVRCSVLRVTNTTCKFEGSQIWQNRDTVL